MVKTEIKTVKIRDLIDKYEERKNGSVYAYHGNLNVRPAYQRVFVYDISQVQDLLCSIREGLPIGTMYWGLVKNNKFEVMDGQQRIISICRYCSSGSNLALAIRGKRPELFSMLGEDADRILNYEIPVHICTCDSQEEKLRWFRAINAVGDPLRGQELRNAAFSATAGTWLQDTKAYFMGKKCEQFSKGYVPTDKIERCEVMETALKWISNRDKCSIDEYMLKHVEDLNADEIIGYYETVLNWVKEHFDCIKKKAGRLDKVDWGVLYNEYILRKGVDCSRVDFLKEFTDVRDNYEVRDSTPAKDILRFIFAKTCGEPYPDRHLNLRVFSDTDKSRRYFEVGCCCENCHTKIELRDSHADHIVPWCKGGRTEYSNLQILCTKCNLEKSDKLWGCAE